MRDPRELVFLSGQQRQMFACGTPILCYHYLGTPAPRPNDPYLYVSTPTFRNQLARLKDLGFTSASLSDVASITNTTKRFAITVDDGAMNFFEYGLSILNDFEFQATQFIVSGQIGGINEWDAKHGHPVLKLMDDAQIRDWLAAGHEIGSHTINHRNLAKLTERDARREIIDSKKHLEDRFGVPIRHFCYPHGKHNELVVDLVREAGYETACTTQFGINTPRSNPLELQRIMPLSMHDLIGKVIHRLSRRLTKSLHP